MPMPSRYDGFDFAPYQFREYPKQVKHGGKDYFVNDAQEEAEILSKKVEYDVKDFEKLKTKAKLLGVKFGNDWPLEKLTAYVKKAEADKEFAQFTEEPSEDGEKTALLARAEVLGITVDKRWGSEKIKAALAEYAGD